MNSEIEDELKKKIKELKDELKDVKEKNNVLVQKVQHLKMLTAEKGNENLDLMKEINKLRLKHSALRSNTSKQSLELNGSFQEAGKQALTYLYQTSNTITKMMELTASYTHKRQVSDYELSSPLSCSTSYSTDRRRSKSLSGKVNKVRPTVIGGRYIQPVVSLIRTDLMPSAVDEVNHTSDEHRASSVRAFPMHLLQDLYIPLQRIDNHVVLNSPPEDTPEEDDDDIDSDNSIEDTQNSTEGDEYERLPPLETLPEEEEAEEETVTPQRNSSDNPLEGPSWLLGAPKYNTAIKRNSGNNEPDSTTEHDQENQQPTTSTSILSEKQSKETTIKRELCVAEDSAPAYSPTVRRRRRSSLQFSVNCCSTPNIISLDSPSPSSPLRNHSMKINDSKRVLKVLVSKLTNFENGRNSETPPKQSMQPFDAPSPKGATDARLIVMENESDDCSSVGSHNSTDSKEETERRRRRKRTISYTDSNEETEGRRSRRRTPISYKEKPLNRKLRR